MPTVVFSGSVVCWAASASACIHSRYLLSRRRQLVQPILCLVLAHSEPIHCLVLDTTFNPSACWSTSAGIDLGRSRCDRCIELIACSIFFTNKKKIN